MEAFRNLIGGEWVGSVRPRHLRDARSGPRGRGARDRSPSATGADAAQAVAAAAEAFPAWAATPGPARGAILFRAAELLDERLDDVATTLTREEGKTLAEAKGEVTRARDILRYFAGEGWRHGGDVLPPNTANAMLFSRREPLGVVAAITPWNFPIAIPALEDRAGARLRQRRRLQAGVGDAAHGAAPGRVPRGRRPAGRRPQLRHRLGRRRRRRAGPATRSSAASRSRARTPSAPGSTRARRSTSRASQLEMGGKNPTIVLDDADLGPGGATGRHGRLRRSPGRAAPRPAA